MLTKPSGAAVRIFPISRGGRTKVKQTEYKKTTLSCSSLTPLTWNWTTRKREHHYPNIPLCYIRVHCKVTFSQEMMYVTALFLLLLKPGRDHILKRYQLKKGSYSICKGITMVGFHGPCGGLTRILKEKIHTWIRLIFSIAFEHSRKESHLAF